MMQTFKRSVSFLLAFVMVLGIIAMAPVTVFAANDYTINSTTSSDGYYNLISKQDWDIAPGITESEIVLNNDDGSKRQVLHVMEADLNNEYVKVINSYTGMVPQYGSYKTGVMSEQAAIAEEMGYGNVVGAMNTTLSWYTGYTPDRVGEPLGFIMLDAEILFDPANCGYTYGNVGFPSVLVINKDYDDEGNPRPDDIPKVEMPQIRSADDLDGWEDQVIPCSSGYIVKDGVNQYSANHSDEAPRSVVGIKPDGTVVIMLNDGRQSPYSAGMSMYELAEVMLDLGCSYAVNCDGGGSSTFLSQRPGEELKVNNIPSDGAERATTTGILFISTAPATGEFYKAHITTEDQYYTPNSQVQFTAIGTDMVGTTADIPADAVWQLADDSFGTIDANGVFTSNGKEGEVTAQMVYNDAVVGEATITIVIPEIAFKTSKLVLPYGEAATISLVVTTNEGMNTVTTKAGDIVLTLSDSAMGTIDGTTFTTTSDTSVSGGTLTASICGDTENAISVEVKFGKPSEVVIDFENDYELIIDTSNTGKNEDGSYIYGWHASNIQKDQYFAYRWTTYRARTAIGIGTKEELYLVDKTTGKVRNGETALAVHLDWTWVTSMGSKQVNVWFPEAIQLNDGNNEATSFGFWIYLPNFVRINESATLRLQGRTAAGAAKSQDITFKTFYSNANVQEDGWLYVSYDVLANGWDVIDYFQILLNDASASYINVMGDYTFYIDDVTIDYSDATIDREVPYFTSVSIANDQDSSDEITDSTVVTTDTITLYAQAKENTTKDNATGLDTSSVKVTVDGQLITTGVTMNAAGKITVSDLNLSNGVHTIRFEICDEQGNVGAVSRKITVNNKQSDVRVELADPDYALLPAGSVMYLNLVADNISDVQSVTTRINLDEVNEWELEGMEVAYGFTATYTVDANNDAIITVTRTGDEVEDTTVLAKLPIRVWMTKSYLDPDYIALGLVKDDPALQDKYYALTPYAMWLSDGVFIIRVIFDVSEGVVTYTDNTKSTFSSDEVQVTTELNRYRNYANDGDANFYQDKASFHIHTAGEAVDQAATCTKPGFTGRVYCVGCSCVTNEKYGHDCDTVEGCGSVIEWGTVIPALGHSYEVVDGKVTCVNGGELFNGVYTDGKTYVDGVVIADGWNADNTAYYVSGVKLTGTQLIDKAVYTFDENGVYQSGVIYNGFISDGEVTMYFYTNTNYEESYLYINNTAYYFVDGIAVDGVYTINGESCLFVDGAYVSCSTADVMDAGWMGEKVTYIIYSDASMILGGEGATYKYTSRAQLPWVEYKTEIRSIVVGKGITALNQFALADIYYTNSITFEEGSKLTYIGAGAFLSIYGITEIVLPDSLETIVQNAFKMCKNLVDVYLPYNIEYMNKLAFVNNQNVVMEKIKFHVYEGTYAESYAKQYSIPYEYRVFVDKVVASGTCGENATWELYQSGKMVIGGSGAMDNYTSKSTTPWADYLMNITDVIIGKDITKVGNFAFAYGHNIKSVTFEEGSKLQTVGAASFMYMLYTTEIVLPDTVTVIGNNAFSYSAKLSNVVIPQNVSLIYVASFKNCKALTLNVAEGTYGESYAKSNGIAHTTRAYVDSVIASGTCGDSATWTLYESGKMVIGGSGAMDNYTSKDTTPWANYLSKITDVVIGKDITAVGNFAFAYGHNIKSVTFEEGSVLESIGAAGFMYMLYTTEIVLPETVTKIGNNAFSYSSKLTSVVIPQNVTLIYVASFKNCKALTLNVAEGTYGESYAKSNGIAHTTRAYVDSVIASGLCGDSATWTLYESGKMVIGGSGAMDNYTSKSTTPWANYLSKITDVVIGKYITAVGNFAFAYGHNIKSVTFEEGSVLETIGAAGFMYMLYTTEIVLPETVTKIGNNAFSYSAKLASVVVPESVTLIYAYSFRNCKALNLTVVAGSYAQSFAVNNGIAYTVA